MGGITAEYINIPFVIKIKNFMLSLNILNFVSFEPKIILKFFLSDTSCKST